MSRVSTLLVLVVLVAMVGVLPASAGLENNPKAFVGTDVVCEGDELGGLLATGQAGHADDGTLGVALYVEITNLGPEPIPVFGKFERNRGLASQTVWCTWAGEGLEFAGWVLLT